MAPAERGLTAKPGIGVPGFQPATSRLLIIINATCRRFFRDAYRQTPKHLGFSIQSISLVTRYPGVPRIRWFLATSIQPNDGRNKQRRAETVDFT
jgi:hypothetical protein